MSEPIDVDYEDPADGICSRCWLCDQETDGLYGRDEDLCYRCGMRGCVDDLCHGQGFCDCP